MDENSFGRYLKKCPLLPAVHYKACPLQTGLAIIHEKLLYDMFFSYFFTLKICIYFISAWSFYLYVFITITINRLTIFSFFIKLLIFSHILVDFFDIFFINDFKRHRLINIKVFSISNRLRKLFTIFFIIYISCDFWMTLGRCIL